METYIGTKIIKAKPMSKHAYNDAHQRSISGDEAEGYLVQYHDTEGVFQDEGYFSWSPKDVFDAAYRVTSDVSFGLALEAMKKGHRAAVAPVRVNEWFSVSRITNGATSLDLHLGHGKVIRDAALSNSEIFSDNWVILD